MSSTSPSDLATTFRSIPRRLREAQGDTPAQVTRHLTSAVAAQMTAAGSLLHTGDDPSTIAAAIEAVPADDWDEGTLDELRSIAMDLGSSLRSIASANPDSDD